MSAADNVASIEEIYRAFGRGDVETILAAVRDDVDWATDAASTDAPWWGQRNGPDELVGFFEGIGRTTEVTEFTVVSIAATDSEVFSMVRYAFTGKERGESGSMHLHHYFRFDDDGKIAYARSGEDTQLVARVLAGQPARAISAATS